MGVGNFYSNDEQKANGDKILVWVLEEGLRM